MQCTLCIWLALPWQNNRGGFARAHVPTYIHIPSGRVELNRAEWSGAEWTLLDSRKMVRELYTSWQAVSKRVEVAPGHASVPSHYDNFAGKKVTDLGRRRVPSMRWPSSEDLTRPRTRMDAAARHYPAVADSTLSALPREQTYLLAVPLNSTLRPPCSSLIPFDEPTRNLRDARDLVLYRDPARATQLLLHCRR